MTLGAVTLGLLPTCKLPLPRGKRFLCVTGLPRVKLPTVYFHGYIKKNKRTYHDSSPSKVVWFIKNPERLHQSHSSDFQTKEITCCEVLADIKALYVNFKNIITKA